MGTTQYTIARLSQDLNTWVLLGVSTLLGIAFLLRLLFGPWRHIPGPFSAKFTGIALRVQSMRGRRVYELDRLHAKYGPIVRIGPDEVSISDWRHLRTIYHAKSGVIKDARFCDPIRMFGQHNIFQMIDPAEHAARRKLSSSPYSLQSIAQLDPIIQKQS